MEQNLKISLKAARVNSNISQKKAAELLGINVVTLRNYESGKTAPRWQMISNMVNLYGVPAENLFLPIK